MKNPALIPFVFLAVLLASACNQPTAEVATEAYQPESRELYDSIVAMDAAWEDAYNHCRLDVMDSIMSEDLEFYHDQGGFMTSKAALMAAVQNNICGKVTRELQPGSIEVYRINGYGAVEMGKHGFHNSQEPNSKAHFAKFVHVWKWGNGKWRITRVISLH